MSSLTLKAPITETGDQPVRLILAAVATVLFAASLGQTVVSTAMPAIVGDLDAMDHITWVITAYLLASTVSAPISGKLGDLYGRKIVLQCGIMVFMAGSIVAGLAWNMGLLVAGRALQGLGAGGLIVVSMAVVADVLPSRDRGKAQGIMGSVFGISTVIGPLLGGFIVQKFNWHWIFFVNIPVGVMALIVLGLVLRPQKVRATPSIDYLGAALLAAFLSSAVLLSNLGGATYAWGSAPTLALGACACIALLAFVAVEARATEPLLPLPLFRINNFVVMNSVGFMVGTTMFGAITFLPLFLQVVKGASPTASGLFLLPMMAGLIGSSFAAGRRMTRTGRYKMLPVASTGALVAGMLLLSTLTSATPLWQVAVFMFVTGIGIGPVISVGVAAIQNAVPVHSLGVGTASANMFRLIGGSIGTSAFGAMFSAGMASALPDGAEAGFGALDASSVAQMPPQAQDAVLDAFSQALHPVFLAAAALALAACLLSLLVIERPLATTLPTRPDR